MTADEIKNSSEDHRTTQGWLREIALQLALLNERTVDPQSAAYSDYQTLGAGTDMSAANEYAHDIALPAKQRRKK